MFTRRERAAHEAGHAVAAHALGKRLELVSIGRDGQLAGFCLFMEHTDPTFSPAVVSAVATEIAGDMGARASKPAPTYSAAEIERRVLICLAGPEAQRRATNGKHTPRGDDFDMLQARQLLGSHRSAWDLCAEIADARDRTRALLDTHWPAVEAVALALTCSGSLTGAQVRLLIEHAPAGRAA